MKFSTLLILAFIGFSTNLKAQTFPGWYAVFFANKSNSTYSLAQPEEYLSEASLKRREREGLNIDSTDLPVSKIYINQIASLGEIKYASKWENAVLTKINDLATYNQIMTLPFVKSIQYLAPQSSKTRLPKKELPSKGGYEPIPEGSIVYGKSLAQLDLIGITPMHKAGFTGEGVLIAIFDAGFKNANSMTSFSHLAINNSIKIEQDLVLPGNDIYQENVHGTNVLSTIAGFVKDQYFGSAPDAGFLLFRTEDVSSEYPIEEFYWLIAAERADSAGAEIISSSVSYNLFDDTTLNYAHSMLDGQSTIVSRAASMAASKGILVVTSAGNEGRGDWRKIGFPSDGIDVITVGAVDTLGKYNAMTSQGNTSDGRIKPEIAAVGIATAMIQSNDKIFHGNGTSFSTPTLAGAVALLRQAHPQKTSQQIREALYKSGSQYFHPDSLMGYGIPDIYVADFILNGLPQNTSATMIAQIVPNPFQSGFYIITDPEDSVQATLTIYDISGKAVFSTEAVFVPGVHALRIGQISELANGIYILKIVTLKGEITRKLIKQQ